MSLKSYLFTAGPRNLQVLASRVIIQVSGNFKVIHRPANSTLHQLQSYMEKYHVPLEKSQNDLEILVRVSFKHLKRPVNLYTFLLTSVCSHIKTEGVT